MRDVSASATSDGQSGQETPPRLPPIACAPWCRDGSGHTNAQHPDDQYCDTGYLVVELQRQSPEQISEGGAFHRHETTIALECDPFCEPHVSWYMTGASAGRLTIAEARQVGTHLVHLADIADQP
jgi:hypothetical protein